MKTKSFYITLLLFCCIHSVFSQDKNENEELKVVTEEVAVKKKKKKNNQKLRPYEPLAPARAAFYSAILPGLGQAYTGKYWKIPIVYGAIGAGVYFYLENNSTYNDLRDVYKARLSGINPDDLEFADFTDDQLIDLQRRFRKDQELSLLITVGLYVLNIIDANVTAHLQQFNVSKDLSFKPKINFNEFGTKPSYGMSLNYSF